MKLQATKIIQNLAFYLVQSIIQNLLIFEIFQSVPSMFEKVAEHRSRVPTLAKKSVTTSCQSSDGWMFEKTVKWSVGEGRRHPVTTRKASFKTLNINQVLRDKQDSNTRLLNRLKMRELYLIFWHQHLLFGTSTALLHLHWSHITSAVGQAKFFAQCETVVTKLE